MEDLINMGENASEMINKLSRKLEHSRELNNLFIKFLWKAAKDKVNLPEELIDLIEEKISIYNADLKEN